MSVVNALRKRIPYEYWLFYDAVIVSVLVYGVRQDPVFILAAPFVAVAVFFDAVEWFAKARAAQPPEGGR